MPIITATVESQKELDQLLAWPASEGPVNRIQFERSSTGGGVGFANIGSKTLVTSTLTYDLYDVNGVNTDYYRWYYSNAGNTFPTAGNREYTPEVQPSDAGADLLCSVGDVKQELGQTAADPIGDEVILDKIRQVSASILGYTRRRFTRNPSNGSTTFTFDVAVESDQLWVPQGLAAVTLVEYATETGGAFTSLAATDWFLDPPAQDRSHGWPATYITLSDNGAIRTFAVGKRVLRLTGAIGWSTIPADIRGVAIRAAARAWIGKGSGGVAVAVGPAGTDILLGMSPADRATVEWYRAVVIG